MELIIQHSVYPEKKLTFHAWDRPFPKIGDQIMVFILEMKIRPIMNSGQWLNKYSGQMI